MLQDELDSIGVENVVIAGDFNSIPESNVYRYMTG